MRLMVLLILTATSSALAGSAPPWHDAARIPSDVDLYVHVEDAAGLRNQLAALPLAKAFRAAFGDDQVASRWSAIAARLGRSEEQCFDEILGTDALFVMRQSDEGADWLISTQIDDATLARVIEGLGGRMCGSGMVEFACQGLVAAWRPPSLVIAPGRDAPLFKSVLAKIPEQPKLRGGARKSISAATAPIGDPGPATLADDALITRAKAWAGSHVQVFARHPEVLAGASVLAGRLERGSASVQYRARFDRLPLAAEVADSNPIDTRLLERFESSALLGVIRRQCDGPTSALLLAVLPEMAPCQGMKQNAGDCWMLLVGDMDGAPASPCRVPMVAVAVEVRDPTAARRQHEEALRRAIEGYNRRYSAVFGGEIIPPEVAVCADVEDPRRCDVGKALRAASHDHPLVRTSSLHWRTVAGDSGNWQVYASHREWLDLVSRRLETCRGADRAEDAVNPREGFMNGSAIATMIESWSGATAEFGVKDPRRFQDGVALIGSLLRGLERVRWQVARPSDGLIEAQVDIEFAPPAAP